MLRMLMQEMLETFVCILFAVNLFEATFREDPQSSVIEDIYPQTENPNPVAELVNQLYATHHEGVAKVWVQDETDIAAMRGMLEVGTLSLNPCESFSKYVTYSRETKSLKCCLMSS